MLEDRWLLPIIIFCALVLGWIIGRFSGRKKTVEASLSGIHSDYFKGLNYVLNEQPDKAIEIFVKMLEVDSETVETHLALGNLFRRRGEVDRAIRIHQNLIARPTLSREQSSMALLQLGQDYMASGLLDRAEGLFIELVDSGQLTRRARTYLLDVYQQEKDWERAIAVAGKLQQSSSDIFSKAIAQFYCEQVQADIGSDKEHEAQAKLNKALRIDPACVRASLLEGKIASNKQEYKKAVKSYLRVEKQDSAFVSETILPLQTAYHALDKQKDFRRYLERVVSEHSNITAMIHLANLIQKQEGLDQAIDFLTTEVQKKPSVRGVDKLVEYVLAQFTADKRNSLNSIKELTAKLLTEKPLYRCLQCGFSAKTLHWQCPSCKTWASVKPIQGVSGVL